MSALISRVTIRDVTHPCFSISKCARNMHVSVSFMGIFMDMRDSEEGGGSGVVGG